MKGGMMFAAAGAVAVASVVGLTTYDSCAASPSSAQSVAAEGIGNLCISGEAGIFTVPYDSVGTCCSTTDIVNGPDSNLDEEGCRVIANAASYCTITGTCPPTDAEFNSNHSMKIGLNMESLGNAATSCCRTCSCYGDPDCVAFDGTRDEWVVCDSRERGTCEYLSSVCTDQLDHQNQNCVWKKNGWKNWKSSGSPCQPDYKREDYVDPVMLMHKRGDFSLYLSLGERGVIKAINMTTSDGAFYMTSDDCWKLGDNAWQSDSAIPVGWSRSTLLNGNELLWHVTDNNMIIDVEIVCARFSRSNKGATRFDIRAIHESQVTNDVEMSGFCSESKINDKKGTTEDTEFIHPDCTEKSLPPLAETCKYIMNKKKCSKDQQAEITDWCERADLSRTGAYPTDSISNADEIAVQNCKAKLLGQPESDENIGWTEYICELNGVERIECMSKIGQFGWDDFFSKYWNGLPQGEGSNLSPSPNSCAKDISEYTTNDVFCDEGVALEYFDEATNAWVQYLFIPQDFLPCDDFDVYAEDHPLLFRNTVRFRQCSTASQCLTTNRCTASVGFNPVMEMRYESCTSEPEECSCTDAETFQQVCDTTNSASQLGSCGHCCVTNELLLNPDATEEELCNVLEADSAFCDVNNPPVGDSCWNLGKHDATLTLEIAYSQKNNITCCNQCAVFGDPFGIDFSGGEDKWIFCDARNVSMNCMVDENICAELDDHAGNPCVWDQAKFDQIQKNGRASIGSFGSPCQPNWKESGDAMMTMYSKKKGTTVELKMGERAVIETVMFTMNGGEKFNLNADDCFNGNRFDAWSSPTGDNVADFLGLAVANGKSGSEERRWTIRDAQSNLYLQVLCIQKSTGKVKGKRINVEMLLELDMAPGSSSHGGYCVDGEMPKGLTTIRDDSVNDFCTQNLGSTLDVCRALYMTSCSPTQIETGGDFWCSTANYPGGTGACQNAIRKKGDVIADNWIRAYCRALYHEGAFGDLMTEQIAVEQCVDEIGNTDIDSYVAIYGKGDYTISGAANCGTDETAYSQKPVDDCQLGISVEYQKGDTWYPEMFIPHGLPPCSGKLVITAKNHLNLFIYPMRTRECNHVDSCSFNAMCAPLYGYNIFYQFEYDRDAMCTSPQ